MTGKGHFKTGVVFSISAFIFSISIGGVPWLTAAFCILGVNAPDYLEIWIKKNPIIPHRTITHFLPLWIIPFLFSVFFINPDYFSFLSSFDLFTLNNMQASALLGFSIGGLLHLLFDIPNPMGIPIFLPWKRYSLNLWKSGEREKTIVFLVFIFTLLYLAFYNNLLYKILNLF